MKFGSKISSERFSNRVYNWNQNDKQACEATELTWSFLILNALALVAKNTVKWHVSVWVRARLHDLEVLVTEISSTWFETTSGWHSFSTLSKCISVAAWDLALLSRNLSESSCHSHEVFFAARALYSYGNYIRGWSIHIVLSILDKWLLVWCSLHWWLGKKWLCLRWVLLAHWLLISVDTIAARGLVTIHVHWILFWCQIKNIMIKHTL